MEKIRIVEPDIKDARVTIEVQYKTWLDTYPNEKVGISVDDIEDRYKNAFDAEKIKRREQIIVKPEPNEKFIIVKDEDKVVGVCFGVIYENKNQLRMIYVLPEYQGKGIGSMLWKAILPFFDKNKDIYVELADYNQKAISFYKKLGFVDTGKRFSDERFRMKSGSILTEMEMKISR